MLIVGKPAKLISELKTSKLKLSIVKKEMQVNNSNCQTPASSKPAYSSRALISKGDKIKVITAIANIRTTFPTIGLIFHLGIIKFCVFMIFE